MIATSTYFVEIQIKKENLKSVLGARVRAQKLVYWSPKQPEYVTAILIRHDPRSKHNQQKRKHNQHKQGWGVWGGFLGSGASTSI